MLDDNTLLKTPLFDLHEALGARMVPFAGYAMPVQYADGVMKEHLHTRDQAGLFDVSHMGQVALRGKAGRVEEAAKALEALVPVDIVGLAQGRQRYGFFTNSNGGISDDLMIANRSDHLFLVVNGACKHADLAHLKQHLSDTCHIEHLEDRALLALQGPMAQAALSELVPGVRDMLFMDVAAFEFDGSDLIVSRSGYTVEDGFEISLPATRAAQFAEELLKNETVKPIGLGARDSLRLEGGLCLYGQDLTETTTPVEAGLSWAISKARRENGARAGGFLGAEVILGQLANGVERTRVGLKPQGRAPMRAGTKLYASETGDAVIGEVTSGGFGPTVGTPIAMAYVTSEHESEGTRLFGDVRGKRLPVLVTALPFVQPKFKRD